MTEPRIKSGALRVKREDLTDERGSIREDWIEWTATPSGCETTINRSHLEVRRLSQFECRGFIAGKEAVDRADNAADVKGALLERVVFG